MALRLHEKNGKLNEMRCNHRLEHYLDAYIMAAGIGLDDPRHDEISVGKVERVGI